MEARKSKRNLKKTATNGEPSTSNMEASNREPLENHPPANVEAPKKRKRDNESVEKVKKKKSSKKSSKKPSKKPSTKSTESPQTENIEKQSVMRTRLIRTVR